MKSSEEVRQKKERCCSFSADEKLLITNICFKYKSILENKKTDHISAVEKKKTSEKVANEVNTAAPNNTYRSPDVLKRFYENRKREARKIAAEEKNSIFATGGGPEKNIKKEPCHEIILNIMNPKTVYGLQNEFDGDVTMVTHAPSVLKSCSEPSVSKANFQPHLEPNTQDNDRDIEIIYVEETDDKSPNQDEATDVTTFKKPADLKKPITPALKRQFKKTDDSLKRHSANLPASRRRPAVVVKALTSSELGEKYNRLVDKRLQIADLQEKKIQKELLQMDEEKNSNYGYIRFK